MGEAGPHPPARGTPSLSPPARTTSMASDLAVSCRSRSAIWWAEVSSSSCRELWRCCTSFSSRRISRSLEARAASSRGPEHSVKFTLSWAQRGAWRGQEGWGRMPPQSDSVFPPTPNQAIPTSEPLLSWSHVPVCLSLSS